MQRARSAITLLHAHLLVLGVGALLLAASVVNDSDKTLGVKEPLVSTTDGLLGLLSLLNLGGLTLNLTSTRKTTVHLTHCVRN